MALLESTERGLYCEAGGFFVDPWLPVEKAVITHGHADHARALSNSYLCTATSENILRHRLGQDAHIETLPYGKQLRINDVTLSLHPAGHILGSAQVRIEHKTDVCVISGDFKLNADPTCAAFEPVECNTFITESTFGLPIFTWPDPTQVISDINNWWRKNRENARNSLLLCYSLGKAQRLLMELDSSIAPIYTHGAVEAMNDVYKASGVNLPDTTCLTHLPKSEFQVGALILAPPSAYGTPWMRKLNPVSSAFASGWMQVRGIKRRKSVDKGFALSDHSDWPSLLKAVALSKAEKVLVTHGYSQIFARYLRENGLHADVLSTQYEGEGEAEDARAAELENASESVIG